MPTLEDDVAYLREHARDLQEHGTTVGWISPYLRCLHRALARYDLHGDVSVFRAELDALRGAAGDRY